jgi:hypothetical protein
MAKNIEDPKDIVNVIHICQVCKHHENHPSRCVKRDMYVGRKSLYPCNEPDSIKVSRRAAE